MWTRAFQMSWRVWSSKPSYGLPDTPMSLRILNLLEDRQQIFAKLRRVFTHRKMAHFKHDGDFCARDRLGRAQRVFWGA